MIYLIVGLFVWAIAHFWKRMLPGTRDAFGEKGKGIVGVLSLIAIVMMIIGYKTWDGTVYWGRTSAMTGINNILMVLAIYLFAASGSKSWITKTIRHPQLTAMVLFSVAHLLVNGDTPSIVLFGGLAVWAVAEMVVISAAEGPRAPYHAVPIKKEISAVVATIVVLIVVGGVHTILGYNPFG